MRKGQWLQFGNVALYFFMDNLATVGKANFCRFLRSLSLACETGSIQKLLKLCEDDKKREQAIQRMRDSFYLRTLKQFHRLERGSAAANPLARL